MAESGATALEKGISLLNGCVERGIKIAVAESCTAGLLSSLITEIPGSSAIFDRGFVTYSDESKSEMLEVDAKTIRKYGSVSQEVAVEMAEGVLQKSRANLAISITGIAGPSGGSEEKPVGLVYIACAVKGKDIKCMEYKFNGERHQVRAEAIEKAMDFLLIRLKEFG